LIDRTCGVFRDALINIEKIAKALNVEIKELFNHD